MIEFDELVPPQELHRLLEAVARSMEAPNAGPAVHRACGDFVRAVEENAKKVIEKGAEHVAGRREFMVRGPASDVCVTVYGRTEDTALLFGYVAGLEAAAGRRA